MHSDPAQGVVDADCRVHGVANLFVAGSSVFPTGGTAPPTLTIVALALRLADHLRLTTGLCASDCSNAGVPEAAPVRAL
jgi:choline dehydrogenase-like flavoprotein